MLILPDARDLIDLTEHHAPVTARVFGNYLRVHTYQIVLSFSNIRELAGPLARNAEFLRVRALLQELETMPHTYIKEVAIVGMEIQAAVQAFNTGTEYQPVSPYVVRWDRTILPMPGQINPEYERLIGLRLDEIVYDVFRFQPQVFAPPNHQLPTLIALLEQDRALLRAGRAPTKQHFFNAVRKHAASHRVNLPQGREDEFAAWVYSNPNRCPGVRLNHETYRQLMRNYGDVPEVGDFSDLAHVIAVPYVEMATLDNRMRDYCSRAARNLVRLGLAVNYCDRLHSDLAGLMQKYP
jgi:hypothetical protein